MQRTQPPGATMLRHPLAHYAVAVLLVLAMSLVVP